MLARQRTLVTPRGRAVIMRQMAEQGRWSGSRRGIKIELWYSTYKPIGGNLAKRTMWRARIGRIWRAGQTGTVFEAISEIETKAAAAAEEK